MKWKGEREIKCPCGNNKLYYNCCFGIHKNIKSAKTAEQLMRSRYSAFTLGLGDYLHKSQSPQTRNLAEKESIQKWAKSVKWLGLEILNSTKGTASDSEGTVEFKATFKEKIFKKVIHENSRFIKIEDTWYYLDAI